MITVQPEDLVIQHPQDKVLYRMEFEHWNAGMTRAQEARVTARTVQGDPLIVRVQPSKAGYPWQEVMLTGGTAGGHYEVDRTVTDGTETKRHSFTVRVVK